MLKSRDITLLTKVCIVKALVFPPVTYCCESWTIKKAEHQRTELWCWRRLLWVPWTARRQNQSILREINPEYSLKGLMLKLKLQHFGHLMRTVDSLEKTLVLGKIEGKRRRGCQRMWWLDSITGAMDLNLGKLWEMVRDRRSGMLQSMGSRSVWPYWVTQHQKWFLENLTKRGAWWATFHRVTRSWTWLKWLHMYTHNNWKASNNEEIRFFAILFGMKEPCPFVGFKNIQYVCNISFFETTL